MTPIGSMNSNDEESDTVEYDPKTGRYRTRYDREYGTPSLAIAEAIAAIEGVDPTALEPLGNRIDAEALDALLRPRIGGSDVRIAFPACGYLVTARSDGTVDLAPTDSDAEHERGGGE